MKSTKSTKSIKSSGKLSTKDALVLVNQSKSEKAAATARKSDNRSSNIISVEEKKLGDVSPETYSYYIRAGWFVFSVFVSILILLYIQVV